MLTREENNLLVRTNPAASARTPASAMSVRGASPMRSKVCATRREVLNSMKPSPGWRRISSPTAMISSARRSIAARTLCISSVLVMARSA